MNMTAHYQHHGVLLDPLPQLRNQPTATSAPSAPRGNPWSQQQQQQQQQQESIAGEKQQPRANPSTANTTSTPSITLPGTFKSMLMPNTTGDISIQIHGIHSLNDLFATKALSPTSATHQSSSPDTKETPPTPTHSPRQAASPAAGPTTAEQHSAGEFSATIQLTYRQHSFPGDAASTPPMSSLSVPLGIPQLSTSPASSVSPNNNNNTSASLAAPPFVPGSRRVSIACNGKMSVTTTTKPCGDSGDSADGSPPSGETKVIRQYDMMLVQRDFEPGQSYFSVTFNKTLVQSGAPPPSPQHSSFSSSPTPPHSEQQPQQQPQYQPQQQHHGKGLMLSGHYACLRNYDIGTVRVHLPAGTLTGDLAPQFASQPGGNSDSLGRRRFPSGNIHPLSSASPQSLAAGAAEDAELAEGGASSMTSMRAHSLPTPHMPYGTVEQATGSQMRETFFASLLDANERVMRETNRFQQHLQKEPFDGQQAQYPSFHHTMHPSSPNHHQHSHSGGHGQHHQHHSHGSGGSGANGNRVRFCYGCGETGHLHKDCPRDQLFCYNCNGTGHSSKNCKKPKPWEQSLMGGGAADAAQQQPHQGHHHQGPQQHHSSSARVSPTQHMQQPGVVVSSSNMMNSQQQQQQPQHQSVPMMPFRHNAQPVPQLPTTLPTSSSHPSQFSSFASYAHHHQPHQQPHPPPSSFLPRRGGSPSQRSFSVPDAWNLHALHESLQYAPSQSGYSQPHSGTKSSAPTHSNSGKSTSPMQRPIGTPLWSLWETPESSL